MWQATSTQKLSGITENTVDLNFLYKDYSKSVKTRKQALKYGWYKEDGKLYYYYKMSLLFYYFIHLFRFFRNITIMLGFSPKKELKFLSDKANKNRHKEG